MKESERSSHWENLAAQLGIEPGPVSRPQQSAAVPPPLVKKPATPPKKPARAQADWDQLARTLGIDVPPRPPKPQPTAARESAMLSAADAPPAATEPGGIAPQLQPTGEERGRPDRREREDRAERRDSGERRKARSQPTAKGGREPDETDAGQAERSASPRAEAAKAPARASLGRQAADQASADEPAERRRRRRRRRRKRSGGEEPAAAPPQEVSQPLEEEDLTEVEFAEQAEEVWESAGEPTAPPVPPPAGAEEAEPTRSRRRRRRRGRRRARGERAEAASPAESAEPEYHGEGVEQKTTQLKPPDGAHAPDGAHVTVQDGAAPLQTAPEPELQEQAEEEDDKVESRPVYRGIPTWEETVGYIIQQNMEARARSPHAGGPRGRGNKGRGHGT